MKIVVDALRKRRYELWKSLRAIEELAPIANELQELDMNEAITTLLKPLSAFARQYGTKLGDAELTRIDFNWSPKLPTTVRGRAYAGTKIVLDAKHVFAPLPLTSLHEQLAKKRTLAKHAAFDLLRAACTVESLCVASAAAQHLTNEPSFRALRKRKPFAITASPPFEGVDLVLAKA